MNILSFFLIAVACLGTLSIADQATPITPKDPPRASTQVDTYFWIKDIGGLDPVAQTLELDAWVWFTWHDNRLDKLGMQSVGDVWTPPVEIENQASIGITNGPVVAALSNVTDVDTNNMEMRVRWSGTVRQDLDFTEFPHDSHSIAVDFTSYANASFLILAGDNESVDGCPTNVLLPQFMVTGCSVSMETDNLGYSHLYLTIDLTREVDSIFLRTLVPMLIITVLSYSVFVLGSDVATRLSISSGALIAIVAYTFVISSLVPYATTLDYFLVISLATVALEFPLNIFSAYIRKKLEKAEEDAEKASKGADEPLKGTELRALDIVQQSEAGQVGAGVSRGSTASKPDGYCAASGCLCGMRVFDIACLILMVGVEVGSFVYFAV